MNIRTLLGASLIAFMAAGPTGFGILGAGQGAAMASESDAVPANRKVPDRAVLEREFAAALAGATLQGFWQVTTEGGLTGTAPMSEPKPESYEITSAQKMSDEQWVILARIRFAEKDVSVPVPVRVVWAEDTAVITLDDLSLPLLGTYSARVMVHHGFYSGVWYSRPKNYGGVLSGRIIKKAAEEKLMKPAEGEHGGTPAKSPDSGE
jgi:hypothetical protein